MKILNLGRFFVISFIFTLAIFAGEVKLKVQNPAIYAGDSATFTIEAKGGDIVFPDIKEIDGFSIDDVSTSNLFSIINGKSEKKIIKSYIFTPTKDATIPSFSVKIDGVEYKTKPATIKVLQEKASSKYKDSFKVELKADKNSSYVGEGIGFSVLVKQKVGFNPDKLNITPPKFENFWVKQLPKPVDYVDGDYNVREFKYIIFPQKDGNLTINPITAQVGKAVQVKQDRGDMFNDPFFNDIFKMTTTQIKWTKIASNPVTINVKPLPQGVTLFGKFDIEARPDKFKVKANEPVNVKIKITGEGNFDDIDKFKIDIPNAVVYADEPKINTRVVGGKIVGEFTQNIAIVPSNNFTIPSFKIRYFDKDTKKVVEKSTKPIKIIVEPNPLAKSSGSTNKPVMQMAESNTSAIKVVTKTEPSYLKYILLIFGLIVGFVAGLFTPKFKRAEKTKKELPIEKAIKKSKNNKELFNLLLPYAKKSKELDEVIENLEDSIYSGKEYKPNKKEIVWMIEEIVSSG